MDRGQHATAACSQTSPETIIPHSAAATISDKELAPAFGGRRHRLSFIAAAIRWQPVLPTRLSLLYF